ncbi:SDR family oxidoreductase [Lentzea sp.]|uniref:SDR family NAD(P)-dependent oxidoreductase n=1 Tax=Lentzea sp. TaxID=56099 RepID=UPI002BA45F31|nr:SDR family oxidoreductase [Lentzea sp.]HUQ58203.1 SDR family oxidoreductase [Lentzea sp.]
MGYEGLTALVTGASKGLGRAYAVELARRGARVVVLARSEEGLRGLAADIREQGGSAEVVVGDLAAPDGPERILRELRERGLSIDLLVNNAGAGSVGPFLTRPLGPQLSSVALNIDGLLALTYAIGPDLVARGSGGIINVSSTAAFQPMPYQASYAATKAFVLSFTEALAEELRGTGVHVMAAHPGPVATGFFDGTSATIHPVADTPEAVAARTLDDFTRRRAVSYPGRTASRVLNRTMTWVPRLLPRKVIARATGALNRRLGLHEVVDTA